MKKIKSRIQRIELIKERVADAIKDKNSGTKRLYIRGKHENRPIITLPIEYVMYRLDNARTKRQQLRYLKNHKDLPRDLFRDPETAMAQEAQEEILWEMISSTGKDFINDLVERGQDDPAIITYDGYIINGNRRTAALRKIGIEHVECVVLPENFNKKEIYDLELDLQISQDFKEPYHWINELIDIEQGIRDKSIDEDEKELARRLRIDVSRLRAKLRMKILVDSFLVWKQKVGDYDYEKLDEAEQDFIELEKETRKSKYVNSPALADQAQKAVFTLIEEKPKEGRSYAVIRDLFRNFEVVYEKVKRKSNIPSTKKQSKLSSKNNMLDALAGAENNNKNHEIVDLFTVSSPKSIAEKSNQLQEAIKDAKAESMEKKDAEAVYESVSEALRQLQGLTIYKNTAKIESIQNKLNEIIKISSELKKQAQKHSKK